MELIKDDVKRSTTSATLNSFAYLAKTKKSLKSSSSLMPINMVDRRGTKSTRMRILQSENSFKPRSSMAKTTKIMDR